MRKSGSTIDFFWLVPQLQMCTNPPLGNIIA